MAALRAPERRVSGLAGGSRSIALHLLDEEWAKASNGLGVLVRYADDFVVLCASRSRAEEARRRVSRTLARLGLQLNPDKTRIVCLTRGAHGFDFLGFHLHKVESWKWRGRYYLQRWPSAGAMASVRVKIRSLTDRRLVGFPLESVVANLNRVLRGWSEYFRYGNCARKFAIVERYVHERLAIFMRAKHGLGGPKRHWRRFDTQWFHSLGVYRLSGRVRYGTAHAWR